MTVHGSEDDRLTKSQRREVAREKAAQLRSQHKKKERRSRALLQGGLAVLAVAIIITVTMVIVNSIGPASPGPRNMLSNGIKIGPGYEAVPTSALQADEDPVASAESPPEVTDIQLYVDYLCPVCGDFEAENEQQMRSWLEEGAATVEIFPVSILDSLSAGTQYSTRAANAAGCVANHSPNAFFEFHSTLLANQPEENQEGHSDDRLIELARESGAENSARVEDCIRDQTFRDWVKRATARALNGPIPNTEVQSISGTPTVFVNGLQYNYSTPFDAEEFSQFVSQAVGVAFTEMATESPSPTPDEEAPEQE